MAEDGKRGERRARRPRRSGAVAEQLAALKGNRDELDADEARKRALEDAALERYAAALVRVSEINAERDRKVEALMAQAEQAREAARDAVRGAEGEQAAALGGLSELGRSAEDIARMTGLPVKRVRSMLRSERPATAGGGSQAAAPAKPVAPVRVATAPAGAGKAVSVAGERSEPVSAGPVGE